MATKSAYKLREEFEARLADLVTALRAVKMRREQRTAVTRAVREVKRAGVRVSNRLASKMRAGGTPSQHRLRHENKILRRLLNVRTMGAFERQLKRLIAVKSVKAPRAAPTLGEDKRELLIREAIAAATEDSSSR